MVHRLLVRDFRCFTEAEVSLHPELTLLVGDNAQGKTSLLEALCVALRLQSPRTSTRSDLIRFGSRSGLVEIQLNEHLLRIGISSSTRRLAVDNAVLTRSADYLQHSARVVWMDHSDMLLVRGGAEHRRRYLDFIAAQLHPHYLPALRHYERLLRSRNHLLKRDVQINWRQAEAYAVALEEHGQIIAECRSQLIEQLAPSLNHALQQLSAGNEQVQISYEPGFDPAIGLAHQLRQSRKDEERSRTTAAGIHRDDVTLLINERPAQTFASEGQQRSLSLALKLAQANLLALSSGTPPLFLIDDVFGELDPNRRRALLSALPPTSQKVITTTTLQWLHELHAPQGWQYRVQAATLSTSIPLRSA